MGKKDNKSTQYLRPTQIGALMEPKMTGNEINMMLLKYNYQEKIKIDKGLSIWSPTAFGHQYSQAIYNTIIWHIDIVNSLAKLISSGKKTQ